MSSFRFTVPGVAVPWMRANPFQGRKLTPKEQRVFQDKVRKLASLSGISVIQGPVLLEITTYLSGRVAPFRWGSGDWDNYGKTIGDALNRIAYADDCQIVDGRVRKLPPDEQGPRIEIRLEQLSPSPQLPVKKTSGQTLRSRVTPSLIIPSSSSL